MKIAWPTPAQERWMRAAATAGIPRTQNWIAERAGSWISSTRRGWVLQFLFGLQIAWLIPVVLQFADRELALTLCGLGLIVAAEWMMAKRHAYRTGLEEALELSGLVMIAWSLLRANSWPPLQLSALVTAVFALAALRQLNSTFAALSALAASVMMYFVSSRC